MQHELLQCGHVQRPSELQLLHLDLHLDLDMEEPQPQVTYQQTHMTLSTHRCNLTCKHTLDTV